MKRNSRITADITLEAHNMLRDLAERTERGKGWLLEKMIRKYCETDDKKESAPRSKPKSYPNNFDEQFERLWQAKGKKGAKTKAYNKYKSMFVNESDETCQNLTDLLVSDIEEHMEELGMPELHLTTYLNQERWERD